MATWTTVKGWCACSGAVIVGAVVVAAAGCGNTGNPTGLTHAVSGRTLYETAGGNGCQECHPLSGFSTTGSAPDLTGRGSDIQTLFQNGAVHNGISLVPSQTYDLRIWVDANQAGRQVYDDNCSAHHRLGVYDTAGSAPNLAGRGDEIPSSHRAGTLSTQEKNDLSQWVDTP